MYWTIFALRCCSQGVRRLWAIRWKTIHEGGIAAVSAADIAGPERGSYAAALDEQAQRKGVHPIASVDELRADVFESDEELEEFLADLEAFRHEHMG
jgi:hypothetical protein